MSLSKPLIRESLPTIVAFRNRVHIGVSLYVFQQIVTFEKPLLTFWTREGRRLIAVSSFQMSIQTGLSGELQSATIAFVRLLSGVRL